MSEPIFRPEPPDAPRVDHIPAGKKPKHAHGKRVRFTALGMEDFAPGPIFDIQYRPDTDDFQYIVASTVEGQPANIIVTSDSIEDE